jgi:hypothetical protein
MYRRKVHLGRHVPEQHKDRCQIAKQAQRVPTKAQSTWFGRGVLWRFCTQARQFAMSLRCNKPLRPRSLLQLCVCAFRPRVTGAAGKGGSKREDKRGVARRSKARVVSTRVVVAALFDDAHTVVFGYRLGASVWGLHVHPVHQKN